MAEQLYWDSSFAIAVRLRAAHPDIKVESVTLNAIYEWVIALPDFAEEPQLANDELLDGIYQEWFELALANQ